jgi:hypothetical protein
VNKKTRTWIIVGVAVVLLLICICVGVVVLGGGTIFSSLNEPYDVVVEVSAPLQAARDDAVTIEVVIENPTTESQVLDSIDVDMSYLDGVHIESSNPAYRGVQSLEPLFEQQSYTYQSTIPPQGSLTVEFHARALKSGDFSGAVDVCINAGGNCERHFVRTVIEE